ncbi:uncharacterized protein [Ptychodera flava]|uniref:uncharacterized protein n=1 Tax=Ptychodera flava TaxID=63121 RepID=UPI00396A54EC
MLLKYRLLILLELRQMATNGALIDAVYDQLLPERSGVNATELDEFMATNPKEVLVVLDGADEVQTAVKEDIMKIISRRLHPMCTVIITSRSIERKRIVGFVDQHYIIKGFSAENTLLYINKYFEDDKSAANELCEKIRFDENMKVLAMNPLNTTLLCILWEDNNRCIPSQLSEIYHQLVMSIFKRFCQKNGKCVPESDQLPLEYKAAFLKLAEMAYVCLSKGIIRFGSKELEEFGISDNCELLQLGILNREYSSARLQPCKFWVFLHKTFQEFVAAYYLYESGKVADREVLLRLVNEEQLNTVCLFTAGLLGNRGAELFDTFVRVLMSEDAKNTQHNSNIIHLAFSCLHHSGNRHTFASKIASATIRHNALTFYNANCTSGFISGLSAIIEESKTMSSTREKMVLETLEFSRPTTYVSHAHGSELFDVVSKLGTLRKFSFMAAHTIEDRISKVIDGNPWLKDLRLTVYVEHAHSLLLKLGAAMRKLADLKCLAIIINELVRFTNFTEFLRSRESGPTHNALQLNDSLEYFALHGFHHAELMFLEVANQISQHGCLLALRLGFLSNGMTVERRKNLTNIFIRNNLISKFLYYTESIVDAPVIKEEENPNTLDNLTGGSRWENACMPGYIDKVLDVTKTFYDAMTKNKSLRYVVVKHCGDDIDLQMLFEALQSSVNIRQFIVILEKDWPRTHWPCETLSNNRSLDLFVVLGKCETEHLHVPPHFQKCEVVSTLSNESNSPILGKASFCLSSRWGVWMKAINAFEKHNSDAIAVDSYAKDQLLRHTLPYFKIAGWQVYVWECKTT